VENPAFCLPKRQHLDEIRRELGPGLRLLPDDFVGALEAGIEHLLVDSPSGYE